MLCSRPGATPIALLLVGLVAACGPLQPTPAPRPVNSAKYDYTPAGPCSAPGSTKLTIALVSPRWQDPSIPSGITQQARMAAFATPRVYLDLTAAMRSDFLEVTACRGYLTKGPFDAFESMVFPDREASQLLLEPELQVNVDITNLARVQKSLLGGLFTVKSATQQLSGNATVGGRVTLTLKEPVTNTRMWARSIEVPAEAFSFTTDNEFSIAITEQQARYAVLDDAGVLRSLLPKLEAMYGRVFRTAEAYLDTRELSTVAAQAADVRKRAGISVPR